MTLIEARNLPQHVAIIMDGNGRWAEQRGLPRTEGHREGSRAVRKIVRTARRLGLKALTLFAFSEQNWGRPELEVSTLMALLREYLVSERDELLDRGIWLRAIGDLRRLPPSVRELLEPLQSETAQTNEMTLTLALSYGGREELVAAAKEMAKASLRGELSLDEVTPDEFRRFVPSVLPGDPDLLIRTGGERRISNFLLWGAAYSELFFSPALWPDFGEEDLFQAIASYQQRERRFGLTSQQVRPREDASEPHPVGESSAPRSGTLPSVEARHYRTIR